MSWIGIITNAGADILEQWDAGGHTLTIDGATVGSGITPAVNMRGATSLASEVDSAEIVQVDSVTDGTRFKVQVLAADIAYIAHEVGIWGHLDNGERTLIALHQDDGEGISVPDKVSSPDFAFSLFCIHAISNTEELQITVDTSVFVTISTLNDTVAGLNSLISELNGRLATLEYMTLQNDFFVPLQTDDEELTLFTDDDGNVIVCDWKYEKEG